MTRLADVADVIRSKNAGPYELTLDIIFAKRFWFEEALRCELISNRRSRSFTDRRIGCAEHRRSRLPLPSRQRCGGLWHRALSAIRMSMAHSMPLC